MVTYRTVFDLVNAGYHPPRIAIFMTGVLIGLIALAQALKAIKNHRQVPMFTLPSVLYGHSFIALLAIGFTLPLFAFIASWEEYHRLTTGYRKGSAEYAEGVVESFSAMPAEGHRDEEFRVNGARFHYSEFSTTCAFHNTQSQGGPLRDGLRVRIWHIGNSIIRLDVE